ncbi:hypothetical protein ACFC09_15695 [Streptomyces sp. NPDC056161]|uniref:hypothetical protein n=1 Tax=Streptomyces sp. NPDC056161 TaxID=3345732 RepID=UPI0035D8B6C9
MNGEAEHFGPAGSAVVTGNERRLAVSHWLLSAALDRKEAQAQWDEHGVALLACGGILSAIRIPAHLVWAAAGTENLEEVDRFLCRFFDGGAVFIDLHACLYYALVPGTAFWKWSALEFPGMEFLGQDTFLGVPSPGLTERRGRGYWCVPMDSPGDLTYPDEVADLARRARDARAQGGHR